jgi:hypothetical protein
MVPHQQADIVPNLCAMTHGESRAPARIVYNDKHYRRLWRGNPFTTTFAMADGAVRVSG